jgi:GT2 family glycosyltransferase
MVSLIAATGLAVADLVARLAPRRKLNQETRPDTSSAAIVIPNWNGRDLLEKYLPSVIAAAQRVSGSEVIVVDNGSTDGSAAFIRERFPQVRVVALENNLGFGGGSSAGVQGRAARCGGAAE